MLGAVISELGAAFRKLKVGFSFPVMAIGLAKTMNGQLFLHFYLLLFYLSLLKTSLFISSDGCGGNADTSDVVGAFPQPARAESAEVYSLGQRPRYRSPTRKARCRRSSSRSRYYSRTARNRGDIRLQDVGIGPIP